VCASIEASGREYAYPSTRICATSFKLFERISFVGRIHCEGDAGAEGYVSMRFRRLGDAHPITRKQITSELSKIKKQSETLLKGH
jgi:hypothetical protein